MNQKKLDITSGNGLRLLSFDGGGVRALSQIKIVENIMERLNATTEEFEENKVVLPCKCFDLIGGSDTGGVLAIMFGKLSMTVEEAYIEFNQIHQEVYTKNLSTEQRTKRLRDCIEDLLRRRGFPIDLKLRGDGGCPCFVVATPKSSLQSKVKLRSYDARADFSTDVTVVEAVLATCAAQPMFTPVSVGSGISSQELIGGTIGLANPSQELITEAQAKFDSKEKVSVILSIGAGHPGVLAAPASSAEQWADVLWRMVTDSEQIAQDIENRLGGEGIYFRFSVNQAFSSHHGVVDDPVLFNTFTQDYLDNEEVAEKLYQCVEALHLRLTMVELEQLSGLRGSDIGLVADVHRSMEEDKENKILEGLKSPDLKPGSFPDECMEGTRRDILQEIENWVSDIGGPNVLWIIGHPGVGKSAIACTMINNLRRRRRLGASFFFQRAYASVATAHVLWRTIAFDLAGQYQSVRRHLVTKLEADPDLLTTGNIDDLFRQLVYEPLMANKNIPTKRLPVVVIDALDECGGLDGQYSRHRKNVLHTLAQWPTLPKWFKLIVTSRGEQDIDRVLRNNSHIIEIFAGPRVSLQSSEDIKAFLTARFQRIADEYSTLVPHWPGDQLIQQLTQRAGGLFIWARTVVEFIDRSDPEKQLNYILEGEDTVGDMGTLYSQILQISFQDPTIKVTDAFHAILGAIIFLQRPLTATSIARLLSIQDTRMQHVCNKLKAVVNTEGVLQINHQTFVEFLLDSKACPSVFCIRREEEELRLAQACFRIMKQGLKFNICGIESSYILNGEIEDLDDRIQRRVSQELFYSSRHWAQHLSECNNSFEIVEHLQYLMEIQFPYWLEVLSVIKRMNTASTMFSLSIGWMKKHGKPYGLLMDLNQFVKTFINVISQSAPHIYISALPFAPRASAVSKIYMPLYPHSLNVEAGGLEGWPTFQSIMYGHNKYVNSVDFSPDGLRIVSGSNDGTLRVWDAETGGMVSGPFEGHTDDVESVAFSPDGERVASGSRDGTIRIWDSTTGEVVAGPFKNDSGAVHSIALSPEGARIVSGSADGTVIISDIETGDVIVGPFRKHTDKVWSVAFSPDGQRIVSGSRDHTIIVWDAKTGDAVAEAFKGHTETVHSVSFSPNGQRVVSGSYDKTVRVWNANTGNTIAGPFEGHTGMVLSVTFSPDGHKIASGSYDGTVRVWDADTGEIVAGPFDGHTRSVTSVAFSPDGSRIASGSNDNTVRVWDVGKREDIGGLSQAHTGDITAVAFSPDGLQITSGSEDCTLRIWNAQTGEAVTEPLYGHSGPVTSVVFSPDGKCIVSGSIDHTVKLWNFMTGTTPIYSFEGHTAEVTCVVFSPNGLQVASGSLDDTVMVWDVVTGDVVSGPFQEHIYGVSSVEFSPDGRMLISVSYGGAVRVWDIGTGKMIAAPFKVEDGMVQSVTISPNGSQIVSGSMDRTVKLWSLGVNGASTRSFEGHSAEIASVSLSRDGRWIVSWSWDNELIMWSVETGEIASGPFIGHTDSVLAVTFSPDSQWIVSGSGDKTIRVWKSHPSTQSDSPFTISSKYHEGWILDSLDRRIFWVPPTLRDGLLRPGAELIIGEMIKTRLNLDLFVYGEAWTSCRSSGLSAS